MHARDRISLRGEDNVLYPVASALIVVINVVALADGAKITKKNPEAAPKAVAYRRCPTRCVFIFRLNVLSNKL